MIDIVFWIIIFTRPFRVGEYISIVGVEGQVESIDLFDTRLSHADRSIIVVPNRKLVGEILHNYGQIRQLNLTVSIGRAQDLAGALAIVQAVVNDNACVLKDPVPVTGVTKLGSGAITIAIAPWVSVVDYASAGGDLNRVIVEKFAAGGIQYPAPPLEIRVADGGEAVH